MPESPALADETPPPDDDPPGPSHHRPSRLKLALVVGPLIVLVVAAQLGDALTPQLVDTHPLTLLALNARNRILVLTTGQLDWWSYYSVGTLRLLASDPLFYLLGWWYGDAAVLWMERRTRTFGAMVRKGQEWFGKAAAPLVLIAPNNFICLFAGSAGMRPAVFLTLNVVGTIGRLFLIRWLGDVFSSPIDWLLDFIREYRLPLTVLSVSFVGFTIWQETRKGETEVEALLHLEEELEEAEEELEHEHEREHEADRAGQQDEGDDDRPDDADDADDADAAGEGRR